MIGERPMKKIICCVLMLVMLVSMSACDLGDTVGKETGAGQGGPTVKNETFHLNETAVFKALKFTATEIKESQGSTYLQPADGKVFVGVKFTIENVSDEDQVISSLLLFEAYVDDVKCSQSFTGATAFDSEMLDGTVAPGKKLIGWYVMEVPENWSSIELNVQSGVISGSSAKFVFTN